MKLGDLIAEYRKLHDLSQRQFANLCDLSNGYISILEKGINPKTGKPVVPTLPQLKKLADGMGLPLSELFEKVEDMPVDISADSIRMPETANLHQNIIRIAARDGTFIERTLNDQQVAALKAILDQMPDVPDDL